jgi:hypothetical protein
MAYFGWTNRVVSRAVCKSLWPGIRSLLPTLGIRAHRVAFGRSVRSKKLLGWHRMRWCKRVPALGWRQVGTSDAEGITTGGHVHALTVSVGCVVLFSP